MIRLTFDSLHLGIFDSSYFFFVFMGYLVIGEDDGFLSTSRHFGESKIHLVLMDEDYFSFV